MDYAQHTAIFWEPKHRRRSQGRPAKNYIDILEADMGALGVVNSWSSWKTGSNGKEWLTVTKLS